MKIRKTASVINTIVLTPDSSILTDSKKRWVFLDPAKESLENDKNIFRFIIHMFIATYII